RLLGRRRGGGSRLGGLARRGRGGALARTPAELDRDLAVPRLARDAEGELGAGAAALQDLAHLRVVLDRLAVAALDDVALLDLRLGRRRVGLDRVDVGALALGVGLHVDAEEAALALAERRRGLGLLLRHAV